MFIISEILYVSIKAKGWLYSHLVCLEICWERSKPLIYIFSKIKGLLRSQQISRDGKALRVSPLMLAVMNGHKEIVRMLVDHPGVFLLATDDCGDTALRYVFHSFPYSIM